MAQEIPIGPFRLTFYGVETLELVDAALIYYSLYGDVDPTERNSLIMLASNLRNQGEEARTP